MAAIVVAEPEHQRDERADALARRARSRAAAVITSENAPPWAIPASSAQTYAAPGTATNPIAPSAKTMLTPTSHGRRPPWRSESQGITNELGIAVERSSPASSSPADALAPAALDVRVGEPRVEPVVPATPSSAKIATSSQAVRDRQGSRGTSEPGRDVRRSAPLEHGPRDGDDAGTTTRQRDQGARASRREAAASGTAIAAATVEPIWIPVV